MARPAPDLVIELEDFEQFGQNLSNFYVINSSWGKVWELICRKVPPESQKIIKLWQFFISLLTSFELTERLVGFSSFTYKLPGPESTHTRNNLFHSLLFHFIPLTLLSNYEIRLKTFSFIQLKPAIFELFRIFFLVMNDAWNISIERLFRR